jgi:hypothetical protein
MLTFHCGDKIPEKNNLKRGKVYFGSWFQSMASWSHVFEPGARQNIMVESKHMVRQSCSLVAGKKSETMGRSQGPNIAFKGRSLGAN